MTHGSLKQQMLHNIGHYKLWNQLRWPRKAVDTGMLVFPGYHEHGDSHQFANVFLGSVVIRPHPH